VSGELKFRRRTGGTGAILSETYLSVDGAAPIPSDYAQDPDPSLTRYSVYAHYFTDVDLSNPNSAREARRRVVARIDELKSALGWRGQPIVRQLGRGRASMPNVYDNFGDLVMTSASGDSLILDNCALLDASIADDSARVQGIAIRLTFARVCDAMRV